MKIRARVDFSKRWRSIILASYLTLLVGYAMNPLAAQMEEQCQWRRTIRGWEYAHAIQASSKPVFVPLSSDAPTATGSIHQWHRMVLPIAVSSFIATFSCWLLLGVPNRGIVRRLG